jgi:electron transfer flavoprotein alpha subunit
MKTLIVEVIDANKLGELLTVSRVFCDKPDLLAVGQGEVPGNFSKVYQAGETIAANLLPAVRALIETEGYELILFSATTLGGGLAAPLAAAFSAPVLSEVTNISQDLIVEKPVYGGKAVASFKVAGRPIILTIRRNYFEKAPLEGTAEAIPLKVEKGPVSLLEEREEETAGIPLEDAEIVVTGGRGIGGAENFVSLREMADLFRGALGASRGAVDEGWMPPQAQVGQTGKIVAPTVYFAIGVSGASQHLAGITNAKCVVAINRDEEAGIFKRAQFGIVEDYKKVIPALLEALRSDQG